MPPCLTVYVTRINSYNFIEDGIFDGLNRQFYDKLTILVFFFRDLLGFLIGILLNLYNVLFSLVPGMFWKNISLPSRDEEIAVNPKGIKATVSVISNDLPFIEWNVRFTTTPFEPLLDQGLRKYSYLQQDIKYLLQDIKYIQQDIKYLQQDIKCQETVRVYTSTMGTGIG